MPPADPHLTALPEQEVFCRLQPFPDAVIPGEAIQKQHHPAAGNAIERRRTDGFAQGRVVHGDIGQGAPRRHAAFHRHQGGFFRCRHDGIPDGFAVGRDKDNGGNIAGGLPFQKLGLPGGAVIGGGGEEAKLHIEVGGGLLHPFSHGGGGTVPFPQDDRHFEKLRLTLHLIGGKGKLPEQHAEPDQRENQPQQRFSCHRSPSFL